MFSTLAALVAWELSAMPAADTVKQYEPLSYKLTTSDGVKEYQARLLKPAQIEPGKKYPLVLFLHGAGERGSDNTSQLAYLPEWMLKAENREKYPCFLLAPQCPASEKWSDVSWGAKDPLPLGKVSSAMQAVIGMLDEVSKSQPVDPDRVYLTGLSMGGYGSWDLGERMPERFAAVAPICGGGDDQHADRLVKVPVWAWHGDADNAVPVERSRRMIEALKRAGGSPKYTELKDVGHDSWTAAYTDRQGLVPWMFEQHRQPVVVKD